ncbi:MAG: hypothetical protein EOO89_02050 [Pedobacter sp.]|nr:MAG: hypothetical protein EOO89_02050 [Pedobacter sp.]
MNKPEEQIFIETQGKIISNNINQLVLVRLQIEIYIAMLLARHTWDKDKDVRINILNQINALLLSQQMNLQFNLERVSNHRFQKQFLNIDTFKEANMIFVTYSTFNKNGLIYNLSAVMERYLRIILTEFDPLTDISGGIYGIKKKFFSHLDLLRGSQPWNALALLSMIRNTIHNNGIYVHKDDATVVYRGESYNFVNGLPHDFATYENIVNIILDFLEIVKMVNDIPLIKEKEEITDHALYSKVQLNR